MLEMPFQKPQMPFDKWYAHLLTAGATMGMFHIGQIERESWNEAYDRGLTPENAIYEHNNDGARSD